MTKDQIKAIAEEYSGLNSPSITDDILRREVAKINAEHVFEPFLRFLNDRYCIVEREKVTKEHFSALKRCKNQDYYDGAVDVLSNLFGKEMFNQNEE